MSRTKIVFCSLFVPLSLFAQPAPDTLWTRVIWDAPGATAKAIVQVEGGFVEASNRGQEVHLCKLDDSGSVVWSRWYGAELHGTINNHQVYLRTDQSMLFTPRGDSIITICINPAGQVLWRANCGVSSFTWSNQCCNGGQTTYAVAPYISGPMTVQESWYLCSHGGGGGWSYRVSGDDSICHLQPGYVSLPDGWWTCDLQTNLDNWVCIAQSAQDSVAVITREYRRSYYSQDVHAANVHTAITGDIYAVTTSYFSSLRILRVSARGTLVWARDLVPESVSVADNEPVLDCGFVIAGALHTAASGSDMFLARFDDQGDSLWSGCYGTPANESANDVVFSSRSGGFVLAGQIAQDGTTYPYIICTRPDTAYWYAEIADFSAAANDSGVEITFSAPIELNVDRYELLRSVGGSYRAVGVIPAGGTPVGHRHYRWVDHLAGGHLQYSLADIGTNGQRREHPSTAATVERVPCQILDFTAREDSGRVLLTMQTAFEYGVDHYLFRRRSSTGTVTVATFPSKGASYGGSMYVVEDRDYSVGVQYIYYPAASDSSGHLWSFTEVADTVLTQNPPSPRPVPLDYTLSAFPNPFNASTTLYFATSRTEKVRIDVYDLVGRFVKTAVNQEYAPGGWRVPFDAAGLSSGIYFARIHTAAGFTATQKLLLLR